jgi:hypothetical protein
MDELNFIEKLAGHARREQPPALRVTAGVLEALRRPQPFLPIRTLALLAVAAEAAAVLILVLAIQAWAHSVDPLATLFPSLEVSLR